MTKYFSRVLMLAKQSKQLSEQELIDFTAALLWADDEDLVPVERLILQRPKSLRWLLENIQAKQQALKSKDQKVWDQILQQEAKWIESL